jgi:hypothetical protein
MAAMPSGGVAAERLHQQAAAVTVAGASGWRSDHLSFDGCLSGNVLFFQLPMSLSAKVFYSHGHTGFGSADI